MSILSSQSIRKRCLNGSPMIFPFSERFIHKQSGLSGGLGPAGYDLTVDIGKLYDRDIYPGFELFSTIETVAIPLNIQAVIHDKSTWARKGLSVQNTIIDPGFVGFITLEITNHSNEIYNISNRTPIAQIVFHYLDFETEAPYVGKYQHQKQGPQKAR